MKRKVQAQRKFAQGVYVPPHAAAPERRAGPAPPPEHNNVFHNNMSAASLLDFVSFQNMHTHLQPVVLLKRLGKLQQAVAPQRPPGKVNKMPGRVKGTAAIASKNIMRLRSRLRTNFKTHKVTAQKKAKVKRRVLVKKVLPPPVTVRKRKLASVVESDLDDDKPLKYFARTVRPEAVVRNAAKIHKLKHPAPKESKASRSARLAQLKKPVVVEKRPVRAPVKRLIRPTPKANLLPNKKTVKEHRHDGDGETETSASDNLPLLRTRRSKSKSFETAVLVREQTPQRPKTVLIKKSKPVVLPVKKEIVRIGAHQNTRIKTSGNLESHNFKKPFKPSRRSDNKEDISTTGKRVQSTTGRALGTTNPVRTKPFAHIHAKHASKTRIDQVRSVEVWLENTRKVSMEHSSAKQPTQTEITNSEKSFSSATGTENRDGILSQVDVSNKSVASSENWTQQIYSESSNIVSGSKKGVVDANKKKDFDNDLSDFDTCTSYQATEKQSLQQNRGSAVEKWLDSSIPSAESFKMPELPHRRISSPELQMDTQSNCPSERLTTVRKIIDATECDLRLRCDRITCMPCNRVNKVRQLKNLVQRPLSKTNCNDVYEFKNDDANDSPRLYNFAQNRRASRLQESSAGIEGQTVYLDIFPQGTHIIQITDLKKPMMRARLILRSEADMKNEFSLIEHENILDQLLQINLSNTTDCNEKNDEPETQKSSPRKLRESVARSSATNNESDKDSGCVELGPGTSQAMKITRRKSEASRNTRNRTEETVPKKSNEQANPRKAKQNTSKKTNEPSTSRKTFYRELNISDNSLITEAPVFYPTEAEFNDPITYFEKISGTAAKYGLCKVVAPPGFKPSCTLSEEIRFNVSNQYIARLYSRWGPASREMCAIKAYLASQSVKFARAPLYEGIEVNLPKLYHIVQRNGGLKNVIEKKRWGRVAEEMNFTRGPNPEKRVDQLYVKYLLPYDTLSCKERQEIKGAVERCWFRKNQKMLERALNPLHRQKRLLGESDSSGDETEDEGDMAWALAEAEDCVVSGRSMNLATFQKVAANAIETLFPGNPNPEPKVVENEYWRLVLLGTDHVCVNTASIDTGDEGFGFSKSRSDPYGKHPWNLKMVSQNSGNVLRSLGAVLGVTVPTLHLGMVFSTSCWHRDPHGLPWVEYMHAGPGKIWYGIPDEQSEKFRKAVETLCPTSCQNKSTWLPSDITMIPPSLFRDHNVSLARVEQNPGEFIVVFPKAYSCSICTGYTQSESVYFAPTSWLKTVTHVFQEVRASCEPTMFSLEQLLLATARDRGAALRVLADALSALSTAARAELHQRAALRAAGVQRRATTQQKRLKQSKKRPSGAWNVREQDECEICRSTLYLSKVVGLPDKRSSVCLHHALRLLERQPSAARDATLVVHFQRAELEEAITAGERRVNILR